jgi:hypothetical protein
MKFTMLFLMIAGLIVGAYFNARFKNTQVMDLTSIRLDMPEYEVINFFGHPHARNRNVITYILEDSSQLFITLRDGLVASAMVKYHRPLKIEDPQLKKLTLVQMSAVTLEEKPSWFFAGKPQEGLIYKITQKGEIESLTWVPPFSYGNNRPKNLQALFRDFKSQKVTNL